MHYSCKSKTGNSSRRWLGWLEKKNRIPHSERRQEGSDLWGKCGNDTLKLDGTVNQGMDGPVIVVMYNVLLYLPPFGCNSSVKLWPSTLTPCLAD